MEVILKRIRGFQHYKKKFKGCLISLDKKYIEDYIVPIADIETTPISIFDHPKGYIE